MWIFRHQNIKFSISVITEKYGYHVISHFKKIKDNNPNNMLNWWISRTDVGISSLICFKTLWMRYLFLYTWYYVIFFLNKYQYTIRSMQSEWNTIICNIFTNHYLQHIHHYPQHIHQYLHIFIFTINLVMRMLSWQWLMDVCIEWIEMRVRNVSVSRSLGNNGGN